MFKKSMETASILFVLALGSTTVGAQGPGGLVDMWSGVEPQVLTDKQFKDVNNVMSDMDEANVEIDTPEGATTSKEAQLAAVRDNPEAMAILAKHGYTPEKFYPIMVNAMVAHAAVEMAPHRAEMEQAVKQMEAMKGAIPESQYNTMMARVTGGLAGIERVPEENIELAKANESIYSGQR